MNVITKFHGNLINPNMKAIRFALPHQTVLFVALLDSHDALKKLIFEVIRQCVGSCFSLVFRKKTQLSPQMKAGAQ